LASIAEKNFPFEKKTKFFRGLLGNQAPKPDNPDLARFSGDLTEV
jgi:hypothetical protein